ncbi:enoyl-CoA hydratase/isomerase family protein [Thermaurantiacus sp.]
MGRISIEDHGSVRTVAVANPPRHYMTATTAALMDEALMAALADPAVRVVVLTGGGEGVFIRHYDVREIAAMSDAVEQGAIPGPMPRAATAIYRLQDRLLASEKPVIAAINVTCMGGGFETALCCTLCIATVGDYPIGLPETRLGIVPGAGGLQLLARAIGLARATDMVLRGRVVGPEEALHLGMVHEVTAGPAHLRAIALGQELAAWPAAALAEVLGIVRGIAAGESLPDGLDHAAAAFLRTLQTGSGARPLIERFFAEGEDILG